MHYGTKTALCDGVTDAAFLTLDLSEVTCDACLVKSAALDAASIYAKAHQNALPRQLVEGDWDSIAWEDAREDIEESAGVRVDLMTDEEMYDLAWETFRDALHREVLALVSPE